MLKVCFSIVGSNFLGSRNPVYIYNAYRKMKATDKLYIEAAGLVLDRVMP